MQANEPFSTRILCKATLSSNYSLAAVSHAINKLFELKSLTIDRIKSMRIINASKVVIFGAVKPIAYLG